MTVVLGFLVAAGVLAFVAIVQAERRDPTPWAVLLIALALVLGGYR